MRVVWHTLEGKSHMGPQRDKENIFILWEQTQHEATYLEMKMDFSLLLEINLT